jgi:hypothetical protein
VPILLPFEFYREQNVGHDGEYVRPGERSRLAPAYSPRPPHLSTVLTHILKVSTNGLMALGIPVLTPSPGQVLCGRDDTPLGNRTKRKTSVFLFSEGPSGEAWPRLNFRDK